MKRKRWIMGAAAGLLLLLPAGAARANLDQQKIFKGVYPGKEKYNCLICHTVKLPKKDAHPLNDYGKKALIAAQSGAKPTAEIYKQIGDPDAQAK